MATLAHVTTSQVPSRVASRVVRRLVSTVVTLGSAVAAVIVVATAAAASNGYEEAAHPGEGLTVTETLLLYVGIPLAIFALIALIVVGPSLGKGPRHRTGAALDTGPVWIDPAGGRRPTALSTPDATDQGGTSAHW
jgi:hypothetical protein